MADTGTRYTDKKINDLTKRIEEVYAEAEKDIYDKIQSFNERHAALEAKYLEQLADGKITQDQFDNWMRGQVFQGEQWEAKRRDIEHVLYNANTVAAQMVNGDALDVFAMNANYMSYSLEHGAGINFGFGVYDEETVKRLLKDNPQLLPQWKVNEEKDYIWNEKKLNNCVIQGIIQGESLDQIADRISESLAMQNKNSSLTFARTAMTGAQNAGRNQSLMNARDLGINVVKQWMATLDGRTRDSHRDMDGETIKVSDYRHPMKFSNGCRYPGDPQAPAREVYNCRCTLVGDIEDYPDEYERYDNIEGKPIRNMTYREWENIRKSENTTGIKLNLPTPSKFKLDFDFAKSTLPKGGEWRVDDTYTVEDYTHKRLLELQGGSVVAITNDGDIVSVCKNKNGNDKGSQLLTVAVANGGNKLDAFGEGLYNFYTKNGFEPVSWTPFNEEYAPHDWVKGRDKPEEVVFYMYTGKTTSMTYGEFISSVPASAEYDDAKLIRDKLIDSKK